MQARGARSSATGGSTSARPGQPSAWNERRAALRHSCHRGDRSRERVAERVPSGTKPRSRSRVEDGEHRHLHDLSPLAFTPGGGAGAVSPTRDGSASLRSRRSWSSSASRRRRPQRCRASIGSRSAFRLFQEFDRGHGPSSEQLLRPLAARELHVLPLMAQVATNADMADRLAVSNAQTCVPEPPGLPLDGAFRHFRAQPGSA